MIKFLINFLSIAKATGVQDGYFAPCPNSPNCVSSQSQDPRHHVSLMFYVTKTPLQQISNLILDALKQYGNTEILKQEPHYIHATHQTPMGFIDDIEFFIDEAFSAIHYRSTSRCGYYDFKQNKKRYTALQTIFYNSPLLMPNDDIQIANKIIDFWFRHERKWFAKDPAFDNQIQRLFLSTYYLACHNQLFTWEETPKGTLALILLLDQFPRNIFRNTPQMYASDAQALNLAKYSIDLEWDQMSTNSKYQMFYYMPLMHSESLNDQELCVQLFSETEFKLALDYAIKHRDIVKKYGRFPHRNQILKRKSTAEEIKFLEQPGSGF